MANKWRPIEGLIRTAARGFSCGTFSAAFAVDALYAVAIVRMRSCGTGAQGLAGGVKHPLRSLRRRFPKFGPLRGLILD
eukprot:8300396-Pyramimonas_sp.AAC.2